MTHGHSPMQKFVVARVRDLPEGERQIVEVAGRQVGIFHIDGRFHAILHRCPHLGGPLCLGPIVGLIEADRPGEIRFDPSRKFLMCPWHGWEFDLETGHSYLSPQTARARLYPIGIESGRALTQEERALGSSRGTVRGPYRAEVIPISVEDDYLVVTMRVTGADAARERKATTFSDRSEAP